MHENDFTQTPDRSNTGSLKWQKYQDQDVLPMWVADMDFLSAPQILAALRARVDHGVYGYTVPYQEAQTAVLDYLKREHGTQATADQLCWLPGLVQGLNLVCRSAGVSGDAVMVNTPVYPPFLSAPIFPTANGSRLNSFKWRTAVIHSTARGWRLPLLRKPNCYSVQSP